MKIAYLIDCESLGGGCEYIRRKRRELQGMDPGNESKVFYSDRGECRANTVDAWGADVVVVNHLKSLLQLLGRPWKRPKGRVRMVVHGVHLRKYLWRMHDCDADGVRALLRRASLWMRYQARRTLEAWLYHRCDEIVALTETDKADILRLYGRGLRVVVEPNSLVDWTPLLAAGSPPGVKGPIRYVCIGRFCYAKGQDRWVLSIARGAADGARRSRHGDRTLFIGDGETLAECKALAAKHGVSDQCAFAGAIPDAERYLKCAEIVVSPSRWEGMPYLLMKARALGCRILATDCPGNRDVLAGYDKWEKLEL